ncbi:MAG: hypothetical protein CMA77_02180 [Euryarchaeota archaeon]|nr:hypothetical protein [Euryarchaeota archaeon]|tara:strand:+ start:141 stop:482 length:342 start_codon:yes stop_codon:yes gene_type:complete
MISRDGLGSSSGRLLEYSMKWHRLTPGLLIALLMLVVITIRILQDGGISTESFAVLLILFIGIFVIIIVSQPSHEESNENLSTKSNEDIDKSSQSLESVLPDPLDEGYDYPLM